MKIMIRVTSAEKYRVTDAAKFRYVATVKKSKSVETADLRQIYATMSCASSVTTVGKIRNVLAVRGIFAHFARHQENVVDVLLNIVNIVICSNFLVAECVTTMWGFASNVWMANSSTVLVVTYTSVQLTTVLLTANRVVSATAVLVRL